MHVPVTQNEHHNLVLQNTLFKRDKAVMYGQIRNNLQDILLSEIKCRRVKHLSTCRRKIWISLYAYLYIGNFYFLCICFKCFLFNFKWNREFFHWFSSLAQIYTCTNIQCFKEGCNTTAKPNKTKHTVQEFNTFPDFTVVKQTWNRQVMEFPKVTACWFPDSDFQCIAFEGYIPCLSYPYLFAGWSQ